MAMDPMKLFQMKGMWDNFVRNHPKFPLFMSAVAQKGLKEDSIFEITVTTPEGEKISSNLKLSAQDIQMLQQVKNLAL